MKEKNHLENKNLIKIHDNYLKFRKIYSLFYITITIILLYLLIINTHDLIIYNTFIFTILLCIYSSILLYYRCIFLIIELNKNIKGDKNNIH